MPITMVSMRISKRILRPFTKIRGRSARGRVHFLNVLLAGLGRCSHQQTSAVAVAHSDTIVNKMGMMVKGNQKSRQGNTVEVTHESLRKAWHALADDYAFIEERKRAKGFILRFGADWLNFAK